MNQRIFDRLIEQLPETLAFSRGTVSREMTKQASFYFRYAIAFHDAYRDHRAAKHGLEDLEAMIWRRLSDHHSRITERMLLVECRRDKRWIKAKQYCNQMDDRNRILESACRALEHRRDMLINMGATMRSEMSSEVSTKKPERDR